MSIIYKYKNSYQNKHAKCQTLHIIKTLSLKGLYCKRIFSFKKKRTREKRKEIEEEKRKEEERGFWVCIAVQKNRSNFSIDLKIAF